MHKVRRSSQEWFKLWDSIISLEGTLSRFELSNKSGASIQIIQRLQLDWMSQNDIEYSNCIFSLKKVNNLSRALYFTDKEKENMK